MIVKGSRVRLSQQGLEHFPEGFFKGRLNKDVRGNIITNPQPHAATYTVKWDTSKARHNIARIFLEEDTTNE